MIVGMDRNEVDQEITRLRAEVEELERDNKDARDAFGKASVRLEALAEEVKELRKNQLKPGEVRARRGCKYWLTPMLPTSHPKECMCGGETLFEVKG